MPGPQFSVITSAFNCKDELPATARSLADQSFQDFEFIVIDGASSDGTSELLTELERVDQSISEPDEGIYDAWNKGIRVSRGRWIAFVGAGDTLHPEALRRYAAEIELHTELDYVSSRVRLVQDGRAVRVIGQPWAWPQFQHHMTVAHVGSVHRRELYERVGLYDTSFRICGDYELLLRAGRRLRATYVNSITASMEMGGTSQANYGRALQEARRAKVRHGRNPLLALAEQVFGIGKATIRTHLLDRAN